LIKFKDVATPEKAYGLSVKWWIQAKINIRWLMLNWNSV